jgi:uncharacterized protein YidB (DUF937 family)
MNDKQKKFKEEKIKHMGKNTGSDKQDILNVISLQLEEIIELLKSK